MKLYPCKTTNTSEIIKHLKHYFNAYSIPDQIVSDCGSCFTSNSFKEFNNEHEVKHILIATACPRANGQVERFNRVLTPVIAKLVESNPTRGFGPILLDAELFIIPFADR